MTKMRKILIGTMLLILLSSVGYGADWKSFGKDADNNEWFYDIQSVSRDQETAKIWTKIVLSDQAKADFIKKIQHNKPPSLSYEPPEFYNAQKEAELSQKDRIKKENINHRIDRYEIDCVKNRIKVMSSAWFDSGENVIHNENPPDPLFSEITPNSIEEQLLKIICNNGKEGK